MSPGCCRLASESRSCAKQLRASLQGQAWWGNAGQGEQAGGLSFSEEGAGAMPARTCAHSAWSAEHHLWVLQSGGRGRKKESDDEDDGYDKGEPEEEEEEEEEVKPKRKRASGAKKSKAKSKKAADDDEEEDEEGSDDDDKPLARSSKPAKGGKAAKHETTADDDDDFKVSASHPYSDCRIPPMLRAPLACRMRSAQGRGASSAPRRGDRCALTCSSRLPLDDQATALWRRPEPQARRRAPAKQGMTKPEADMEVE